MQPCLLSQYVSAASNMIVELFVDGLRTRLFRNHAAFHVEANACSTYIGLIVRCFLQSDNLSSSLAQRIHLTKTQGSSSAF